MPVKPLLIYPDTSVFGAVFDQGMDSVSARFFEQARAGDFTLLLSTVVISELEQAPSHVRALLEEFRPISYIYTPRERDLKLQQEYVQAGILTPKWTIDALHVAAASVSGCDVIVSWNFAHIVHYQKVPRFNAVNILQGYNQIAIISPAEVVSYDE